VLACTGRRTPDHYAQISTLLQRSQEDCCDTGWLETAPYHDDTQTNALNANPTDLFASFKGPQSSLSSRGKKCGSPELRRGVHKTKSCEREVLSGHCDRPTEPWKSIKI